VLFDLLKVCHNKNMKKKYKQGEKIYIQTPIEIKSIDVNKNSLEAIFSTESSDRHGDVVVQDGWDLKNFNKNPVILNSHNYGDATEVIGKAINPRIENKKLVGEIIFAVNENPKAKIVFDLYAGGFLNAFSVGFIPKKFEQNKDGTTNWNKILEAELLEVSAVSVPANALALAKEKGIEIEKLLDDKNDENKESKNDTKRNIDEASKDSEIQNNDEQRTSRNNDSSESESYKKNESAKGYTRIKTSEEIIPTKTYLIKIKRGLNEINTKEKEAFIKISKALYSLVNTKNTEINDKIKEKIKQRKINKVIRELIKLK